MTVEELAKQLQEIIAEGKGHYQITFDGGEALVRSTYVMDDEKCVDMCDYGG